MNNRNWEDCKGCLALVNDEECGLNICSEGDVNDCPCAKCLVKMMCPEKCYLLSEYMDKREIEDDYIRRMLAESRRSLQKGTYHER